MKKTIILLSLIVLSCNQKEKELPILKTNSETLSIQEGNVLYPNIWKISPELEWDEYNVNKFTGNKKISFCSDIDTLTFDVVPNNKYEFIVSYKDQKAKTRIITDTLNGGNLDMLALKYKRVNTNLNIKSDTIPFSIGADNRIYIEGKVNHSKPLKIIFDTGANSFAITSSLIGEQVAMKLDGTIVNNGTDGSSIKQTSSGNTVEVGNLVWENIKFTSIDYKNLDFDIVMGWTAFADKIVEINYDKKILVIHPSLKRISEGYSKIETMMIGGIPYIKGTISVNDKNHSGWFEYDTGANGCFYLSQKFTQTNKLNFSNLELKGTAISSGSQGVKFKSNVYHLPKLRMGDLETYEIPIDVAEKDPEGVEYTDILGNDLLKRFNAIIDFKNYEIYLKPNQLLHSNYDL